MFTNDNKRIKVTITPSFQDELSSPMEHHFVWEYNVCVENLCDSNVKLLSRNWCIIDSDGTIIEIKGEGVIGQQPIIASGESFEYSSYANLRTSSGIMKGRYKMLSDGNEFEVEIPAFPLDNPHEEKLLN